MAAVLFLQCEELLDKAYDLEDAGKLDAAVKLYQKWVLMSCGKCSWIPQGDTSQPGRYHGLLYHGTP